MSKPMSYETPMFKLIERQLVDAVNRDTCDLGPNAANVLDRLGPQARAVLAEILGYTHAQCTQPPGPCTNAPKGFACTRGKDHAGPCAALVPPELDTLHAEVARLRAIINTPESDDFLKGVSIEAEYQRARHAESDANKTPPDWIATISFLSAKALCYMAMNNFEKARHHMVSAAACLKRWHSFAPSDSSGK